MSREIFLEITFHLIWVVKAVNYFDTRFAEQRLQTEVWGI